MGTKKSRRVGEDITLFFVLSSPCLWLLKSRGDISFNFSSQAQTTCSGQRAWLQLGGSSLSDCAAFVTPRQMFQHADTSQRAPVSSTPFPHLIPFQVKNVPMSRKHRQEPTMVVSSASFGELPYLSTSLQQQW